MDEKGDIEQQLIQQQMEETRTALSDKLDALENQVADTVQTATDVVQNTKEAVAETVESVKETVGEISDKVGDTVRSVVHTFDFSRQIEERPWLVFGGCIGLGCMAGWYLSRSTRPHPASATAPSVAEPLTTTQRNQVPASREPSQPGWMSQQLTRLRGLAVGVAMGAIRDLVKQNFPDPIGSRVAEEVDSLTPQMGGEVIHGPILPESLFRAEDTAEDRQNDANGRPASFGPTEGKKPKSRTLVGEWD